MFGRRDKLEMPTPQSALAGRDEPMPVREPHVVSGRSLEGPYPEGTDVVQFGLGCFWGAERVFWQLEGVWVTAVGYAAGLTPNPTYDEVCSGRTGHNEVVLVVFDPNVITFEKLVQVFFESHDPTQGMRQGNDIGTQYRSGIYVSDDAQRAAAERVRDHYQAQLRAAGFGEITTEILDAGPFYFAETYHQQYLARNPNGYCGLGGTGVACASGLAAD